MVKALANFQAQAPQGEVVGNLGGACRAKQNRVMVAQSLPDLLASRNDFLADPVALDTGDAKVFHL